MNNEELRFLIDEKKRVKGKSKKTIKIFIYIIIILGALIPLFTLFINNKEDRVNNINVTIDNNIRLDSIVSIQENQNAKVELPKIRKKIVYKEKIDESKSFKNVEVELIDLEKNFGNEFEEYLDVIRKNKKFKDCRLVIYPYNDNAININLLDASDRVIYKAEGMNLKFKRNICDTLTKINEIEI